METTETISRRLRAERRKRRNLERGRWRRTSCVEAREGEDAGGARSARATAARRRTGRCFSYRDERFVVAMRIKDGSVREEG
tara:strand:+ start:2179 stop:2424 length:246 start_codon:yes stop_codon:yes gene_type:complete